MYLTHYSSHSATTRELSLLSINTFQKDLSSEEQLVRAMSLRCLTSICVLDILPIQVMAVERCSTDSSPYVRKCGANAVCKVWKYAGEKDAATKAQLLRVVQRLLEDKSTMVMGSAVCAFSEGRRVILARFVRLARLARVIFVRAWGRACVSAFLSFNISSTQPFLLCCCVANPSRAVRAVSPDKLDMLHCCYRNMCQLLCDIDEWCQVLVLDVLGRYSRRYFKKPREGRAEGIDQVRRKGRKIEASAAAQAAGTVNSVVKPRSKVKRRVVRKAFYSDEEDESSVEEVFASDTEDAQGGGSKEWAGSSASPLDIPTSTDSAFVDNDDDLDPDHRLLLRSSLPLLKSRNSGVVLAVCQLHFYSGVSTIEARQAIGKALVRIHRDRREIQYVVLQSIRYLVVPAPSAFAPFINEFFVRATDTSFARLAKLDILTSLALNRQSCDAVLREFRTYIRHNDRQFVLATIKAVGRLANQFRTTSFDGENVALNCLRGLLTLIGASRHPEVVGGAIVEARRILQAVKLSGIEFIDDEGSGGGEGGGSQNSAISKIVCLLLSNLGGEEGEKGVKDASVYESGRRLPADATASMFWIVGEWGSGWSDQFSKVMGGKGREVKYEILRLAAQKFATLEPQVKLQAVHMSSKFLLESQTSESIVDACEYLIDMGGCDVDHDVRDRSRFEKGILKESVGWRRGGPSSDKGEELVAVSPGIDEVPEKSAASPAAGAQRLSRQDALRVLTEKKKVPSTVQTKPEDVNVFRFGTLSSLVGEKVSLYEELPDWAESDSPAELREPKAQASSDPFGGVFGDDTGGERVSADDDSSSDDSEEDSSSDDSDEDSSSEDDSDDSSSSDDDKEKANAEEGSSSGFESSSDEGSDYEDSEDDNSDEENSSEGAAEPAVGSLLPLESSAVKSTEGEGGGGGGGGQGRGGTSDFEGLSMLPITIMQSQQTAPPPSPLPGISGPQFSMRRSFLKPEIGGGLKVSYEVCRGQNGSAQKQGMGLGLNSMVMRVQFENCRSDGGSIRRVRLLDREGLKKSVLPSDISILKATEKAIVMVGMDFGAKREKDSAVKLEVKTDRGSHKVELKVPLEERLSPLSIDRAVFEKEAEKLGGFQKVSLPFAVTGEGARRIPEIIMLAANVAPVDNQVKIDDEGVWRGAALASPSAAERVLIVACHKGEGEGLVTVHSDNAIICSGLVGVLRGVLVEKLKEGATATADSVDL